MATSRSWHGTSRTSAAPPADRQLRACLGNFLTGVTVVTCRRGTAVHGITVNSFTSVSLDPPLVLIGLDRGSRAAGYLGSGPYAINFLTEQQRDLALHFAGKPMRDPVCWETGPEETPLLPETVGYLVCRPWRCYDGGDHVLLVGSVESFAIRGGRPLGFFRGGFPKLSAEGGGSAPWFGSLDDPVSVQEFAALHHMTSEGQI